MNTPAQKIGTPLSGTATRLLLLGSGELGKEVVIEAQRYGVECIAVDRYADAPAMQVAHRSHVISMLDGEAIRRIVELEKPHFIVPEIEAIHTPTLLELEREGYTVIPTARAARLTMDREGIRRLAAEELKLPTSPYRFADTEADYRAAVQALGMPCVIKPVMSSSGKGQSVVKCEADIARAWSYAQAGGRAGAGRIIVEGFIPFDYEITLLTVRHAAGTSFCAPIGHLQIDGDYRESWQPHPMSEAALRKAEQIAKAITEALGGRGIFGVELFVKGDEVIFSEVSPRPHDTGMVTMISQDQPQFALHVRAILGLPIPNIRQRGAAASCAILLEGGPDTVPAHGAVGAGGAGLPVADHPNGAATARSHSTASPLWVAGNQKSPEFKGLGAALQQSDTQVRLFGKPEIIGKRRMGVALALGESIEQAREKARVAAEAVQKA